MGKEDLCRRSKLCSQKAGHLGSCNDVLSFQCVCEHPAIVRYPAFDSATPCLGCSRCHRFVPWRRGRVHDGGMYCEGPVAVENVESDDGRLIALGALVWMPPVPILEPRAKLGDWAGWARIGLLSSFWRVGNVVWASGSIDARTEPVGRLWVGVDLAPIEPVRFGDPTNLATALPTSVTFTKARIAGCTVSPDGPMVFDTWLDWRG